MAANDRRERSLLDIVSYARRGPGERIQLSRMDLEMIRRTVARNPEVMVKVVHSGGQNLKNVQRHLSYLSRNGNERIETDEGHGIYGKRAEVALLNNWDLDLEEYRRQLNIYPTNCRKLPRLIYKVVFSMPPGTAPAKVLKATQNFAREQFWLKHRYAMVLHTNVPHPHVHMVLKALSEEGVRLDIQNQTLREWRSEFARHLRELGVPANATERAVRGQHHRSMSDGRYRAQRGRSTFDLLRESPSRQQTNTASAFQADVQRGWDAMVKQLYEQGDYDLAQLSDQFYRRIFDQEHQSAPAHRTR